MSEKMVEISVSDFDELETLRLRQNIYHLEEEMMEDFDKKTEQIDRLYKQKSLLEKEIEMLKFQRLSLFSVDELPH